ncbi:8-oxo-dGTP diphosphatase [Herbihabitans rhizosphaerae]|uniref:8-oxo-dGTP diphosphatase n=1 Tax=Herbihabitans rhizosphaerae TaxID=1872711 RepID=A0A4V2ESZ2_9PSEU|nr:NUDIX hydrolase [Herbihabitans rhizosphaerae]RZS39263.1 8-oxo-dGTP diphosphatase [Herbihabitans rhizosphaerae]
MTDVVRAAGAVVWRMAGDEPEVAVVHRPRYDDWSLPKGKLDDGETVPAAAVREVAEETGFDVVLGRSLGRAEYSVTRPRPGPKTVDYFAAHATGGEFAPNDEVDELRWLSPADAVRLVGYPHDESMLQAFGALPAELAIVLLVRHAKAGRRSEWTDDDSLRPLTSVGHEQARALAGMLPLFGADRVFSAPRVRCVQTVQPVADALGVPVTDERLMSEEGYWHDERTAVDCFLEIVGRGGTPVVCSQGGAIPDLVNRLAVRAGIRMHDIPSKKASTWVLSFESTVDGPRLAAADYLPTPLP